MELIFLDATIKIRNNIKIVYEVVFNAGLITIFNENSQGMDSVR